jgi:Family of unknown function (DUF5947)
MTASPTLRRLAQQRPPAVPQEQCELCSQAIPSEHRHLLEMPGRQVRCVCSPCSVLFARENRVQAFDPDVHGRARLTVAEHVRDERLDGVPPGSVHDERLAGGPAGAVLAERPDSVPLGAVVAERPDGGPPGAVVGQHLEGVPAGDERDSAASVASGGSKFRLIPDRRLYLADFDLSDAVWDQLRIPVGIAFVLADGTAFYPGVLGATQAFLDPELWQQVQERNPVLRGMQPQVEALLVNHVGDAREHYLVPIDACYRLVGLIRLTWRGLTGGSEVWAEINAFFRALKEVAHAADR